MTNLTCRTPTGVLLFRNLTLRVRRHESLLIMGPSGSGEPSMRTHLASQCWPPCAEWTAAPVDVWCAGKSSLLRVLAGLWPFEEGSVTRPLAVGPSGLFFLPQRPYLTAGSLRAQLLYPEPTESQRVDDEALVQVTCRCVVPRAEASRVTHAQRGGWAGGVGCVPPCSCLPVAP